MKRFLLGFAVVVMACGGSSSSSQCPGAVPCGAGYCMPIGGSCCDEMGHYCAIGNSCCGMGCITNGAECCGANGNFCNPGKSCCNGNQCC